MTAHKLEYYVAQPQHQPRDQQAIPSDVGLLLGTPVASHIFQDSETLGGDTGRRAQFLADELGVKVIAWQDLGPKVRYPGLRAARQQLTAANFSEFVAENAPRLAEALHGQTISRTIMRVHSGTGPVGSQLAIDLHNQPDIQVSHLAISDPVGLMRVSFLGGLSRYMRYNNTVAGRAPEAHRNDPPTAPNTFSSFLADVAVRGTTTWLSDITYRNIVHIGQAQHDTAVRLHLPGNTFNGTPQEVEHLAAELRARVDRPDKTFVIDFEPNHYHSSAYDNLKMNVHFIRRTIELARFEHS